MAQERVARQVINRLRLATQLVADEPNHPYARLSRAQLEQAMQECLAFLGEAGLPYKTNGLRNSRVITPVGTLKTTYAVPGSMAAGVLALAEQKPTLLVDFFGLKGFSARQIIETLGPRWPGLRRLRIAFPGAKGELYTEHAARALDAEPTRRKLVAAIYPHLGSVKAVGCRPYWGCIEPKRYGPILRQRGGGRYLKS